MSNINVIEKIGSKKGKTLVILAGIHGNEKVGIKILKRLIPSLDIKNGKVIFIFANLEAIRQNKRFIEYNLNRCFLTKQSLEIANTLEGKTAREIIPYLDNADFMLDIHSSNTPQSIPFIICGKQSFSFAKYLPFEIVSYNWDEFEYGTTDYYMNLQNKVGICIECGYIDDKKSINRAKKALFFFLQKLGAISGEAIKPKKQKFYKIINLYKNKFGEFKKLREFSDFEEIVKKTLVGIDGAKKVYSQKGSILLFVRDRKELESECFLVAKETLLNQTQLNNKKRK